MIKLLKERPKETLHIEEPGSCAWHELSIDKTGDVYGWIGVCIIEDQAGLHLVFSGSIIGVYNQAQKDFKGLKRALRDYGVTSIVASNPNTEDKRWPKLIKNFGFPEPELVYISTMEI